MKIRSVTVFLLMLCFSGHLLSQTLPADTSDPRFFLRKELAFKFIAHTSGFGFGLSKSYSPNVFTKRCFETEIVNMKSPKEVRTVYPFADNSKSYVYGKLNYFFLVRAGYGYEKLLNRKPMWGGVEVRYLYHIGASLGFAKPIYLLIINYIPNSDKYTLTTEKYDPARHFYDNIYGRAPFNYGFNQIKLHPGLYAKAGFQFDFGSDNERVKALEAGAILDAYPDGVKIMAFNDPKNLFLTFYLSLNLGKRYNRNIKDNDKKTHN
ncbi:MAG: hypothetical protein NTU44_17160 [Bacteroidetes bacterium]|nr:hypothetical protein [Bacteroidota bacterium]